jgi:hypothetical protein
MRRICATVKIRINEGTKEIAEKFDIPNLLKLHKKANFLKNVAKKSFNFPIFNFSVFRIRTFLGLPDSDSLAGGTNPDLDPSIIGQVRKPFIYNVL